LGSVPVRRDPRDALVGSTLRDLPVGATVATGSPRRQAVLASLRPDLRFVGLRGNIATRVARADDADVDAIVVAVTGAEWVGLGGRLAERLPVDVMVPQVGQGAMALEHRQGDALTLESIASIEHQHTRLAVDAERSFLRTLGGGCDLPLGAYAVIGRDGAIHIRAVLAPDVSGMGVVTAAISGHTTSVGAQLAELLQEELARQCG
jgi:hydroxymethylbilane synthase